jgi:hypothetical protein
MALKWASAAAALAVAIGVGVLSYEHQNRPTFRVASSSSQIQEKSVAPAAQPWTEQNSEVPNTRAKAEMQMNAVNSRGARARVMADASAQKPASQLKKAQGGVLGSLVAGSRARTFAGPNVADAFMASNAVASPPPPPAAPADAKASTTSDITAAGAVVGGVPAPAASAQPVVEARSNVQLETTGNAAVEGSTYNGPARASLQQQPASLAEMKTVAPSAIGGPVRKAAIHRFMPIAHWTISSNGKLQRESSDGRFTSIEPAPGVSIRAVAAQGIEVWAAGAQPDLSTKQWQQRPVLFHSSDAGESWVKIDGPWQSPINALSLDGANALTVTTPDGSWTTLDAGKSWTKK